METAMTIAFPPLPYAQDALAPHISADTLATHHGKHHKAYVDKVNAAIEGTDLAGKSLEEIIHHAERSEEHTSELQSLMRISYAVFCLKNKKHHRVTHTTFNITHNSNKQRP